MHFTLIIPALNEQDAIAATLERSLAAAESVTRDTAVQLMSVVFVNDGSTDGTQRIVDEARFDGVVKVRFERNRGYGAAIKAGFRATDADLVGFMDADGTCDPQMCTRLLEKMFQTDADVVLATRLNSDSQMPLIRRVGNILFARLLGVVSGKALTDAASGFRVIKRASLKLMTPLPEGLHFTPAMSAICLLDPRLRIEEVPAPYRERIGHSKLSVVKDGFRFLFTILFAACCYAPLKTMLGFALLVSMGFAPLIWAAALIGGAAGGATLALPAALIVALLIGTGVVVHQLNFLLIRPLQHVGRIERVLQHLIQYWWLMLGGAAIATAGVTALALAALKVSPSPVLEGVGPRLIFTLAAVGGVGMAVMGVINRVVWAVGEKQRALIQDEYRVETPPAPASAAHAERNEKGVVPGRTALEGRQG